ncbi:MAG: hypothetical protein GXC72_01425 [Chitinophagaceae bacterium]|jgi:hypothetical protein|nr:hypothetical protein [Chitinophagaceae bacterium]
MKRYLLIVLLTGAFFLPTQAQQLTGSWVGFISIVENGKAYQRFFYLDLVEVNKKLYGVYSINDSARMNSYKCLESATAKISADGSRFDLFRDKLIDYPNRSYVYETCNSLSRFSLRYSKDKEDEYLSGKWYSGTDMTVTEMPGGQFVLVHTRPTPVRDIAAQFSRVAELKKPDAGQGVSVVVPESYEAVPQEEKILIHALKRFLGKAE